MRTGRVIFQHPNILIEIENYINRVEWTQVPGALMAAFDHEESGNSEMLDPVFEALYGQLMTSSHREEAATAALIR